MSIIKACMRCFSKNVKRHLHHDKVELNYFPLIMDWVCEDCGYRGIPIVFCSKEDYERFISIAESHKSNRNKEEEIRKISQGSRGKQRCRDPGVKRGNDW